jgi:ferredoxin
MDSNKHALLIKNVKAQTMNIKSNIRLFVKNTSWNLLISLFKTFNRVTPYLHYPIIGSLLKKLADLEPGARTQGYTLNLNVSLTKSAQGVIMPIDMMKQAVTQSNCRAIMNKCLCRSTYSCKHYPHDHACLFLGEGARRIVKEGAGRSVTLSEALSHIDKGAELGLIGQALWIEVERFLLGIKRQKDVAHWLEMCFCCPCCCGTFRLARSTKQMDIKQRFQSIGWKAVINHELCIKCEKCINKCPINIIYIKNDDIIINQQNCLGCGFCAINCPKDAITLELRTPLLGTVEDYFTKSGLRVDI